MSEITGGCITNSDFFGTHIDIAYVDFSINIENHHIIINFKNQSIIKDNKKMPGSKYLFLKDSQGVNITILDCYICKRNSINFDIVFQTIIIGSHINQLQSLEPSEISFKIGSSPIPLLNIHLPHEKVILDSENVEIQIQDCKGESYNVELIIKPMNIRLTVNDLEGIFFNILDIFFLCLGFYPYIEMENIRYNDINMNIHHLQSTKYQKNNSYAHWSTIIASNSSIDLKTSYPIFKSMHNKNELILEMLTNAIHSTDIFIDTTLSLLIQCVEGYMREWHSIKKFPDKLKKTILNTMISSLDNIDLSYTENSTDKILNKDNIINSTKGLLGLLNQQSLGDRLKEAFNINEFTRMILKYEFENEKYEDFIDKSIATRNQFSHMSPKDKVFKNVNEMIVAKDKYILLLRLLMLNDIKIPICNKSALQKYIDNLYNKF